MPHLHSEPSPPYRGPVASAFLALGVLPAAPNRHFGDPVHSCAVFYFLLADAQDIENQPLAHGAYEIDLADADDVEDHSFAFGTYENLPLDADNDEDGSDF